MFAPKREFYSRGETDVRILFDLRIAGSAERLHRERSVWQVCSDIEALDEDHYVLIIRPEIESLDERLTG
jgi:hypothetical protein